MTFCLLGLSLGQIKVTRPARSANGEFSAQMRQVGLRALGRQINSGAVTFELITATMSEVNEHLARYGPLLRRMAHSVDWQLDVPFDGTMGANHTSS